jgi:RHS repeat-associated protein
VAAIEDANGVVTKASYNAIGQRTSVSDPNQGGWGFAYNALGEVLAQSDARGIVTQISYDILGRPQWRTATVDVTGDGVADTVQDHWNYDPANAKGAPANDARTINGATERWTGHVYDSLARPIQTDVTQALGAGTQNYRLRTKYDGYYGRPIGQEYPNGEAVQVLYSSQGHAIAETDPATGTEYRRLDTTNARGQATQETFGNGVVLTPTYQSQTGQLTGLTYSKAGSNLRQLGYGYDVFGNLTRQTLNAGQSREDYSYDQLHRLVQSIRSGAASGTVSYGFDAVGNLTKKSDFSSNAANAYQYTGGTCGGGANAVKTVNLAAGGSRTYCYDANGNLTGDNAGLSIAYDHQNLPTKATRGAQTDWFRYGADGMRTRSWGADGSRVYLPGYEHRTDTGETKVYVGDYAVIRRTGSTRTVEYLLKDRLGSVDAVANSSGTVTETRGYDAFGKPRDGSWNDLTPAKIASTAVTPKGFTQHEHLNQLELIHMNGRAFDYHLGRFTGVDPFIQFPLNSQSLNPYSYILNNPLAGTDPTGYTTCDAGGDATDCANSAGPGGEAKVYQQNAGSHIKTTVGTVKNNGDGSATFTNNAGQSRTIGGNGGTVGQGVTGSESRKNQSDSPSRKGSQSNSANCGKIDEINALREQGSLPEAAGPNEAARKLNGTIDGTSQMVREGGGAAAGYAKENPGEVALMAVPGSWFAKLGKILRLDKLANVFSFGEKAASRVISFRRAEAAGVSIARLPFKDGDTVYSTFLVSKGTVEFAAEARIAGTTLHLKDIAIYPRGAEKFDIGIGEVLVMRSELVAQARSYGFEKLRISGVRYSGAKPGKIVDQTIDLTE